MTKEDAVRLATAIAKANGNPAAEEWGQKVGEHFEPSESHHDPVHPANEETP